jgi:protoporphyrinogen oxidase
MSTAAAPRRAFVLGGGVAGLAAAFGLAERGFRTDLLESRRWCGGRAFSFDDKLTGERLDNGPHAMLGCYHATRALLRRLGTEGLFAHDRALRMAYRTNDGRVDQLALRSWPVPLAMPFGLFGLQLPFGTKLRALWGMSTVAWGARAAWTLQDWLRARRQHGAPDAFLWRPLCRAIMNVEPDECAARDFLATLREAFLAARERRRSCCLCGRGARSLAILRQRHSPKRARICAPARAWLASNVAMVSSSRLC